MSAIADNLKRQRLPVMAIVAGAVMAGLVWLSLVETRTPSPTNSGSVAAPGVRQPDWKTEVSVEGRLGRLTALDKAAFNEARPEIVALVQNLYDNIFLGSGPADELVAATFSKEAAASLKDTKLGLPSDTVDVRILKRTADIGLEAEGSRHAAAEVTVVATGEVNGSPVKVRHASTLWLERVGPKWKVIAFEVTQGPLK